MKDLPVEMLVLILGNIKDPLNLLRFREVCTRWIDIIDYLLIKLKRWTELCFNNNVQPWIDKVIEKRFPLLTRNEWKILTQLDWKHVYISYRTWQTCHLFKLYNKVLFNFGLPKHEAQHESITSMDVRAGCLAIGSYTGIVRYFFIEEKIQPLYSEDYPHFCVTNIKFWYTDTKQLIAVISLENRFLEFWDVNYKKSIPSSLINHPSTSINYKIVFPIIYISDGHRLFVANNYEIFECVWNGYQISKGKKSTLGRFPLNPTVQPLDIIVMNIDPDHKLTAVRCDYRIVLTNKFRIPVSENSDFQPIIEGCMKYYEKEHFRKQQFIFSYPITDTFLIINDEHLHVCLRNLANYQWKTFVLQSPLRSNISAFFMHANVLLFGLKSGSLLMYVLENVQHLLEFTTKPAFIRTFKLDNQPITNLNVAEYNYLLYIFVTVGIKLYVVTFPTE